MKKRKSWIIVLAVVLGCSAGIGVLVEVGGIKITKPMLRLFMASSNKLNETVTYADSCDSRIGIPYVQNGTPAQVLDVYYAKEKRKDAVVIDIHGGFYVAGMRQNYRPIASVFLKEGYDVVLIEYRLNDGTTDVSDELQDCAAAMDYLTLQAEELGLNKERMFLTGDSAGGHLALYMAEGAEDRTLPIHTDYFTTKGVLLNCPSYDFASFANPRLFTKSAMEWFIGPRYEDQEWTASISPRTFFRSYSGPLFVSTSRYDFIRFQSLLLKADCDSLGRPVEFIDIASTSMKVGHIHNVLNPGLNESKEVNSRMIQFLNNCLP